LVDFSFYECCERGRAMQRRSATGIRFGEYSRLDIDSFERSGERKRPDVFLFAPDFANIFFSMEKSIVLNPFSNDQPFKTRAF
jgi:hypothetical protein